MLPLSIEMIKHIIFLKSSLHLRKKSLSGLFTKEEEIRRDMSIMSQSVVLTVSGKVMVKPHELENET